MTDWPASLPRYPKDKSWTETRSQSLRSFTPDQGKPIYSAANSLSYTTFTGTYIMNEIQMGIFWEFWDNTLTQGLGTFNMYHPRLHTAVSVEFLTPDQPPTAQASGKNVYNIQLSFRVLPA